MSFRTEVINSVGDLLEMLPSIHNGDQDVWFRGHSDFSWKLEPILAREDRLKEERVLMRKFMMNAHFFLENHPKEDYEWLFIMQHYEVPTRLLDWTENPLIALYFSIFNKEGDPVSDATDGALWCLYPNKLNEKVGGEILSFGEKGESEELLKSYRPHVINIHDSYAKPPIAIIAARQSNRIYAQQGVFTISHIGRKPIEDLDEQGHVVKIKISPDAKKKIKDELGYLKINALTVFPELGNVGKLTKAKRFITSTSSQNAVVVNTEVDPSMLEETSPSAAVIITPTEGNK